MEATIKEYELEQEVVEVKDADKDLYMKVDVGNANFAVTLFFRDGKKIGAYKSHSGSPSPLGKPKEYEDTHLEIETRVLPVNNFTDRCVITNKIFNKKGERVFVNIENEEIPPDATVAIYRSKYTFKILGLLLLLLWGLSSPIQAQVDQQSFQLQDLETPTSPGFILLDEAPASIEKPSTPQGLGLSLLGLDQNGIALEVAPYWLKDHPDLSPRKMFEDRTPFFSHLGVSVAIVKSELSTQVGAGMRTRLFRSYGSEGEAQYNAYEEDILDALMEDTLNLAKLEQLRMEYIHFVEHPTFAIDIAFAIGAEAQTNSFDSLQLNRWATWVNFNWRPKAGDFYFTLQTRYLNMEDPFEGSDMNMADIGSRFNYDIKDFTVSVEYLRRLNFTQEDYSEYRLAAICSYEIADNIFLSSTIGKNFSAANDIIALAGVNFGVSKSKLSF